MYVLLLAVLKLDNYIRISVRSADECADKEVGPKGRQERETGVRERAWRMLLLRGRRRIGFNYLEESFHF